MVYLVVERQDSTVKMDVSLVGAAALGEQRVKLRQVS
jgi:hypothetical protein